MSEDKCAELIERVAEAAADKAVRRLLKQASFKRRRTDSFRKTEELLEIYPKLDKENPIRQKVCHALKIIMHDEYYGVIEERYFYRRTLEEIAEISPTCSTIVARAIGTIVRMDAISVFASKFSPNSANTVISILIGKPNQAASFTGVKSTSPMKIPTT